MVHPAVTDPGSTRLPWRQRAAVALAPATRLMANVLMGTALAVYIGERGSPFAVGLIMTAFWFGMMFFSPIWGAIADVTGRRRAVLVVTGVSASLAAVPLAFVGGVWGPLGLRVVYAVFAAGFAPVMLAIVSAHGGREGRGRALGSFNSAMAVGVTVGQLAVGVLLASLAPQGLFLVIAAISLVSTVAVALVADPIPPPETAPTIAEIVAEVRTRLLPAREDRGHLRTNGLRWLYVAISLRSMSALGVLGLMAPFLITEVGVSPYVMGGLLAINSAAQTVFMVLFGRVADGIGRKPLIVFGLGGSAAMGLVAAAATVPDTLLVRAGVVAVAMLLAAASYSALQTGALAFIGDVAPVERESELMGLRSTAKGVGGVIGPPVIGAAATVLGYEVAFAGGTVLAWLGTGLVLVAITESRPAMAGAPVSADD